MTNKPVYEIVKVLKNKIFIIGLGDPPITDDLELVYDECNKQFPNKRIIFIDDFSEFYCCEWSEIVEKVVGNVLFVDPRRREVWVEGEGRVATHCIFIQYNEKIPKIKGWNKILKL